MEHDIAAIHLERISADEYKVRTDSGFNLDSNFGILCSTIPTVTEHRNDDSMVLSFALKAAGEKALALSVLALEEAQKRDQKIESRYQKNQKKIQEETQKMIDVIPNIETRETVKRLLSSFKKQINIEYATSYRNGRHSFYDSHALRTFDILSTPIDLTEAYHRRSEKYTKRLRSRSIISAN